MRSTLFPGINDGAADVLPEACGISTRRDLRVIPGDDDGPGLAEEVGCPAGGKGRGMRRFSLVVALAVGVVSVSLSAIATGVSGWVDFESPALDGTGRQILDPYVDGVTGVVFTADPLPTGQPGQVELVKNRTTSVCVEPASDGQLLGTRWPGTSSFGVFPIRATFPVVLDPPVDVSVDVQTLAGQSPRVRLFDASGTEVGGSTVVAGPAAGTCGNPGAERARTTLNSSSNSAVAYVVIDIEGNYATVFAIDDFVFTASTDSDADGVVDDDDLCPGTDLAADSNSQTKTNRLWSDDEGIFRFGDGADSGITVTDTGGCSAIQVIIVAGLGDGHEKFGISKSAIGEYLSSLD